jgi:hypothetical protein
LGVRQRNGRRSGELIAILAGAGETVCMEHRSVKDTKKKETLDQLDSLKWISLAKIEAV